MNGEILSTQINDYIARYRLLVEQENRANLFNINIRAESFFIPILKNFFDCPNLINLNIEEAKNFPGLDLGDIDRRFSIQVTSDSSSSKVVSCLEKFVSDDYSLYRKFDRLVIFIIQNRQKAYRSKKIAELTKKIAIKNPNFQFDPNKDIFDLHFITDKINSLDQIARLNIHDLLMMELDGEIISPLRKLPESPRQLIDIPLVGRENEYDQLSTSTKDILLIGQPGIGKTFLLFKISQEKNAYFVLQKNLDYLSKAIEILKPDILIIDDAHNSPDLLTKLRLIRESLNLPFRIIATCWPTEKKNKVKQCGQFGSNEIIELELFDRDQLAVLIKSLLEKFHLERSYWLEQRIINQSNGLPGFAVGLFLLCKNSNGQDVINGIALLSHVTSIAMESRNEIDWFKTKKLLAYFSIGGTGGMAVSEISKITKINEFEIDTLVSSMHYGGIVIKKNNKRIIQPSLLRAILVKDEFFSSNNLELLETLLQDSVPLGDFIPVVLDIAELGTSIPEKFITDLLKSLGTLNQWEKYYNIYPTRIIRGIEDFPSSFHSCVTPGLFHIPNLILPKLLENAGKDQRTLHQHPDHVLRKIQDWINWGDSKELTIERRKILLDSIKEYLDKGGDQKTIAKLLAIIISPKFEAVQDMPGSGNQISWQNGVYSLFVINQITILWPDIFKIICEIDVTFHFELHDEIQNWIFPERIIRPINNDYIGIMRKFAANIISNLASISLEHPSLLREYNTSLKYLNKKTQFKIDPIYATLFPDRDEYIKNKSYSTYTLKIKKLAKKWREFPPQEISDKIKWGLQEASIVKHNWPILISLLSKEIAENVQSPILWGKTFFEAKLPSDCVSPFVQVSIQKNSANWKEFAYGLINSKPYFFDICNLIFTIDNPPEELFDLCLLNLDDSCEDWIKFLCNQKKISIYVLSKLLTHPNKKIAFSSAVGEWQAEPIGSVRGEIIDKWKEAISQSKEGDYLIKDILIKYPDLILTWLTNYLFQEKHFIDHELNRPIFELINFLDNEQRKRLLKQFTIVKTQPYESSQIIKWIVGDSGDIFDFLLEISNEKMKYIKFAPLETLPNESNWCEKALIAINRGFSKEEIVAASLRYYYENGFSGPESGVYKPLISAFIELEKDNNTNIKEIAKYGSSIALEIMKKHLVDEKNEDIFGID